MVVAGDVKPPESILTSLDSDVSESDCCYGILFGAFTGPPLRPFRVAYHKWKTVAPHDGFKTHGGDGVIVMKRGKT